MPPSMIVQAYSSPEDTMGAATVADAWRVGAIETPTVKATNEIATLRRTARRLDHLDSESTCQPYLDQTYKNPLPKQGVS